MILPDDEKTVFSVGGWQKHCKTGSSVYYLLSDSEKWAREWEHENGAAGSVTEWPIKPLTALQIFLVSPADHCSPCVCLSLFCICLPVTLTPLFPSVFVSVCVCASPSSAVCSGRWRWTSPAASWRWWKGRPWSRCSRWCTLGRTPRSGPAGTAEQWHRSPRTYKREEGEITHWISKSI